MNVAHHASDVPIIAVFNLHDEYISSRNGDGIDTEIQPLTTFQNHTQSVKIVINELLKTSSGVLKNDICQGIRMCVRIFSWMHRQAIYSLCEIERSNTKELSEQIGNFGWWQTLDYEGALRELSHSMRKHPKVRLQITSSESKSVHRINPRSLEKCIGLPVHSAYIPTWFRIETAKKSGKEVQPSQLENKRLNGNNAEHYRTLRFLNLLSNQPDGIDSINFTPFLYIATEVKRVEKIRKTRLNREKTEISDRDQGDEILDLSDEPSPRATPNFPIDAAVKMLSQAISCVYEWRAPILAILDICRTKVIFQNENNYKRSFIIFPFDEANSILQESGIPLQIDNLKNKNISRETQTSKPIFVTLNDIVKTIMFASAFLCMINHGRRPNEVIGRYVPYGLYFGCVNSIDAEHGLYSIDIYIEKQPREYAKFWCTKLVADCVQLLEDIHQRFRPLSDAPITPHIDLSKRRLDHLFFYRNFSQGSFLRAKSDQFHWRDDSHLFFDLAGVDESIFSNRQIPCRRMFISLFVRRYDLPELVALQNHMLDLSIESLRAYYLEPAHRKSKDRHEQALRAMEADAKDIENILISERSALLKQFVERLLRDEPVGGAFPMIISKVIKKLSRSVEFQSKPVDAQADKIVSELARRGYELSEKQNGNCMAGKARHMRGASHCYEDGNVRPENASPKKCQGCIHSLTSTTTILIFEQDRDRSVAQSEDKRLPPAVRKIATTHASEMDLIIKQEMALAERNRAVIAKVINDWNAALDDFRLLKEDSTTVDRS
ncbi:hypothetical protein AB4Y44_09920 [Paraburkholderia sp. BR10937]|uniref:hypothetical protein n=1 Tax=Paraburkholderia sp. BR10937 TaxID=3236994 RepID=UPI0034D2AEC6